MGRVALALLIVALTPASAVAQAASDSSTGDRVVITGPVTIDRGETADDVVVIDGDVSVAGRVRGDLIVVSGKLRISGTVDGDVAAVAERATLAPGARVGGDLIYGDERPLVPAGATVEGDIDRVSVDEITDPAGFIGAAALWIAVSVSALILGLLLLWLAPRALEAAFAAASSSIGAVIGWGLLLFFGLPILAVIALVTLVGIPLGVALLLALLPLYAIGYTTSAWLLGRRLVGPPRGRVLAFLAGLAILRSWRSSPSSAESCGSPPRWSASAHCSSPFGERGATTPSAPSPPQPEPRCRSVGASKRLFVRRCPTMAYPAFPNHWPPLSRSSTSSTA